METGLKLN